MWPAVFLVTQFSRTEPCSSALPGASRLWVHHFADHTLPGVVLLLGERPLCRESSFLLICHHCREWADAMGHYWGYCCRQPTVIVFTIITTGSHTDATGWPRHTESMSYALDQYYSCPVLYHIYLLFIVGNMIITKCENSQLVSPCWDVMK